MGFLGEVGYPGGSFVDISVFPSFAIGMFFWAGGSEGIAERRFHIRFILCWQYYICDSWGGGLGVWFLDGFPHV